MNDQNTPRDGAEDAFEHSPGFSPITLTTGPGIATLEGVGAALTAAMETAGDYMKPDIIMVADPTDPDFSVPAIAAPNGTLTPLTDAFFDGFRDHPRFRRGTAKLLDLPSFIAHVARFADDGSVIYANNNRAKPSMTAVLDYHKSGAEADARFGKHRSDFQFPLSDEWTAWQAKNGEKMSMVDFAAFLEDRIINVMPSSLISLSSEARLFVDTLGGDRKIADPANLMQLATEFKVYENSVVKEAKNLATGEATIEFQSEHLDATGQKLVVPSLFVIAIPVFKGGDPYQIIARLRYRKAGPQVVFWFELWRTDLVFDHAFKESVDAVKDATGLPVYLGTDEG